MGLALGVPASSTVGRMTSKSVLIRQNTCGGAAEKAAVLQSRHSKLGMLSFTLSNSHKRTS
jgi:hypothetical protein